MRVSAVGKYGADTGKKMGEGDHANYFCSNPFHIHAFALARGRSIDHRACFYCWANEVRQIANASAGTSRSRKACAGISIERQGVIAERQKKKGGGRPHRIIAMRSRRVGGMGVAIPYL